MANPYAGEVALVINARREVMKLTLGALAELEAALEADSLIGLVNRFEDGAFSSRDVAALIVAGLRGAGADVSADDLMTADIEGGPVAAARAAAELLVRAFALPGEA
ncbi:MAG: gene transfer agent family protein [Arenibacterium sp.]